MRASYTITTLFFLLLIVGANAQVKKDSVEKKPPAKKVFRQGIKLISTTPKDNVKNDKSKKGKRERETKVIETDFRNNPRCPYWSQSSPSW